MPARLTSLFRLWALGSTIDVYLEPEPLPTLKPCIVHRPGPVMFGIASTPQGCIAALRRAGFFGLGLGLQSVILPTLACSLARAIGSPAQLLVGSVPVGASPGGAASNVIC